MNSIVEKLFYKSQRDWINDDSPLKIIVKSRQTGFSWCNCYRLVLLVSAQDARLDAYISSRDLHQARLQLDDCRNWADLMNIGFSDKGEMLLDDESNSSAYVLQFANGRRIYSLSSNPNALAGKRGHVTLDEFALHKDQSLLYRVAKPVTTWGGQLSIISTHRGFATVFFELIRSITQDSNPMGWSFHSVPIQKAVAEGIVERINKKTGRNESRAAFLARIRTECLDEEQWLQEYCCVPSDQDAAFFSYQILTACEDHSLRLMTLDEFVRSLPSSSPACRAEVSSEGGSFFLGLDIARKKHLCVMDVGQKIGEIVHDRVRLELQNTPFAEIKSHLYRLLKLPEIKRCCIDATGLGIQLAEEAKADFGWKVEPITFTSQMKEEL